MGSDDAGAGGLSQHQDVHRVQHRHANAERDPQSRMSSVAAGSRQAADQHQASDHHRKRDHQPTVRALAEHGPGGERHQHDLEVVDNRAEASPYVSDRVAPQDQVGGQEHSGEPRQPATA